MHIHCKILDKMSKFYMNGSKTIFHIFLYACLQQKKFVQLFLINYLIPQKSKKKQQRKTKNK